METCPFCGKAFKRLKSHLPHCKQAGAKSDSIATEQAKKSPKSGTKKALLEAEAKEQNVKNKGGDNMELAKKTQLIKKKHKNLESSSFGTQKTMLKEKENKKDVQNSHLDQAHGNNYLIDKKGNRSGDCPVEDPTPVTILQTPEVATSLLQTGPVHVTVPQTSARQAFPGSSESLGASGDILTWTSHKEEFRDSIEKTGSVGVKSTLYKDVSEAQVNCYLTGKERNRSGDCPVKGPTTGPIKGPTTVKISPEVATSLVQTGPVHVAVTQSQTSARQALPGSSESLKASGDNLTWTSHKEEFRDAIEKTGSIDVKSTLYKDVSEAHIKSYLTGNDGNRSGDCPIKVPTTVTIPPEVATSLVQTGPMHVAITQSQTSARQALPGSSETLNTSEEKLTWPSHQEEFEQALEKMESIGVKSLLYEEVSKTHGDNHLIDKEGNRCDACPVKGPTTMTISPDPEVATSLMQTGPLHATSFMQTSAHQALPGNSRSLKASMDNLTWLSHKEEFRGAVEKMGSTGVMSTLYEDVSKIMEDARQGDNHSSFGYGFKGSFHEEHFQKLENQHLEQPSEPGSSFLLSTTVSSSYSLHSKHAQLQDSSHHLQTHDFEALRSTKTSLEGQLELAPANKTKTFLPARDMLPRNCSLGLQWIPELHSNYIQLKIVPEKMDLTSSNRRMGKSISPRPADNPESCKPTHHQLIPLTSRQLMDVRIGELSSWLALQRFSMKTIPALGLRAWTRYYNKYINVRKSGIGGLTMILASYCVLSYSWNYHHIRQDRWRKYH